YPTSSRDDDISARHFVAGDTLPDDFPPISDTLQRARERANKELSHLTRGRISGDHPQKRWDFKQLTEEVARLLLLFANTASPAKLHCSVPRFVQSFFRAE